MYYKNYSIGYSPDDENVCILKYDRDMTGFKDSDFNRADHIVGIYEIPTFEFENYKNYLDDNGLLLGIFPSDIIEKSIQEYFFKLEKFEKMKQLQIQKQVMKPISNEQFIKMKNSNFTLKEIINYIDIVNEFNLKYNGKIFSVEEYYKDILIKYWGDFKV